MNASSIANQINIRQAVPEDAGRCGQICYEAFTAINEEHRFPSDIPSVEAGVRFLKMVVADPGFLSVVGGVDGQVVGSNCFGEKSTISCVGPLTVTPAVQNRAVGRTLMQAVMDRAYD